MGSRLPPAVELIGITKRFGQVTACDGVDLALHRGRVHGILGENGAGKSTLMKVLIGLVLPDAGQIRLDGVPVQIVDPVDAAARGIGMVHQHLSLVEALTVWENVALGDVGHLDPRRFGSGWPRSASSTACRSTRMPASPSYQPACASGWRSSRLRRDPDVLVFDEPTSLLTPAESDFLFAALRRVVEEEQRAVALVSHKLPEVLAATDEITMRATGVVDTRAAGDSDAASLARAGWAEVSLGRALGVRPGG